MVGRLKHVLTALVAALVVAPVALSAQQQGRFRVLIPYFEPLEDADDDFGKDASKSLRELINTLATHEPIEEKAIKDEAKRFDMKIEDLNCIFSRQLAAQIAAQVALCASYTELPGKQWQVNASFFDVTTNEEFKVSEVTVGEKEHQRAAQHIFGEFDLYVQQLRAVGICAEYAQSQQWENALTNCDRALVLNPEATSVRYQRAILLNELERFDESLAELQRVLEDDPIHEGALQRAGYISAQMDQDEQARVYYRRYLEINPGNAAVRMNIAYDLARAGDPIGGMELIQVGLDVDPENVDLWEQYGSYAFSAAVEAQQSAAMDAQDAGGLSPEAQDLYRQAINAYEKVFEGKGAETPVAHLRNIIAAYIQLEELQAAIDMGERVLQTHAQQDQLWSLYADALQRAGRIDDAIAALDRLLEINPSHTNASLRQGSWLIQAGRIQDAVNVLKVASEGQPERAEQAARLIFADGYQKGYQAKNWAYGLSVMTAAKELPGLSQGMTQQLNFWHGFILYNQALVEQEPNTLATAQATLPKFKRALELLNQSGAYPATVNVNLTQVLDATNTYIEIQEAIIKRGR